MNCKALFRPSAVYSHPPSVGSVLPLSVGSLRLPCVGSLLRASNFDDAGNIGTHFQLREASDLRRTQPSSNAHNFGDSYKYPGCATSHDAAAILSH